MKSSLILFTAFLIIRTCLSAQPASKPAANPEPQTGPRPAQAIVLAADDLPAFPTAPLGFDQYRESIPHGKIEMVEYPSTTVGNTRKMSVYTPPGYSHDKQYPVLYLLHGIGGDEMEWRKHGAPEVILDNLIADRKAAAMIVILPNGRAQINDRAEGDVFRHAKAFETFEQDLLKDLIPFVEKHYPVRTDSKGRALAGLSMGGGQSLNFGLGNLGTFAWVGGFSSAPNTKPPATLVPNPEEVSSRLSLLWISCGDRDGLISISQRLHRFLKEKGVCHVWHVDNGKHDFKVWKNDLYLFAQKIFR